MKPSTVYNYCIDLKWNEETRTNDRVVAKYLHHSHYGPNHNLLGLYKTLEDANTAAKMMDEGKGARDIEAVLGYW